MMYACLLSKEFGHIAYSITVAQKKWRSTQFKQKKIPTTKQNQEKHGQTVDQMRDHFHST